MDMLDMLFNLGKDVVLENTLALQIINDNKDVHGWTVSSFLDDDVRVLVDGLERDGLIERMTSGHTSIRLTTQGHQASRQY